jgi:hypothetical protein
MKFVVMDEHGYPGKISAVDGLWMETNAESAVEAAEKVLGISPLYIGQTRYNITEIISHPIPNEGGNVRVLVVEVPALH